MFERYTERARRVLFFGRYEASHLGSTSIETEHLLLGLIREGKGLVARIFARANLSPEDIRRELERRTVFREKVSTSVEIPFSAETKRVLGYAAEEADRLRHNYIGTEHQLLGILREERSLAATILMEKGMRLDTVRDDILQLLNEKTTLEPSSETGHRDYDRGAPRFVPSRTVHIAYSTASAASGRMIDTVGSVWVAHHFMLREIVAFAWEVDLAHVRLDSPREHDESTHYDFMIALPKGDHESVIPELLRDAIEQQLGVDVSRDEENPIFLIVKART